MQTLRAFLFLFALILVGCTQASESARLNSEAVEGEVSAALDEYGRNFNAGEWEKTLQIYADDPRFYWVEDGRVAYPSYQQIAETVRSFYPALAGAEITSRNRRILPLSGDHAYVSFDYDMRLQIDAERKLEFSGTITALFAKTDAGWKMLTGHSSSKKDRGGESR